LTTSGSRGGLPAPPDGPIGLVGVGAMGIQVAHRLLRAGSVVIGYDIDASRLTALEQLGGTPAGSVSDVARDASTIVTLLPSGDALTVVCDEIARALRPRPARGSVLVELSTLGLATKRKARDLLAPAHVAMLDGALSGTAVQARSGDVVVYSSGDERLHRQCEPMLRLVGRSVYFLGEFGRATKTKLVANHLVAVHVAAAAEALLLARRSGLDPDTTIRAVADGAGMSRMLEIRGPMMAESMFEPPSMRMDLFLKDLDLIAAFSRAEASPTPMFDAAAELFERAVAEGYGAYDTAAVSAWLDGSPRPEPGARIPTWDIDPEAPR